MQASFPFSFSVFMPSRASTSSAPARKHKPEAEYQNVVAALKRKRQEGSALVKAAAKEQRRVDRAHKRLMKKATALTIDELALILGMKAAAIVDGAEFDASSADLTPAERIAQSILELGREKRDAQAGR